MFQVPDHRLWIIATFMLLLLVVFVCILLLISRSKRKQSETAMQERIADLHRSRMDLENALGRAQASNSAKSAFLANLSREIQTPLNNIIGFSRRSLDDAVDSETREYLGKIIENTGEFLQIVQNILDISALESGKMEIKKIPFDLHDLLDSCRALIMPSALEKGLNLYFYAEPSVSRKPLGDPTRLRQILVQLLSNAVKYTNNGMVKLYSKVKERDEKTVTMHFEVKDSGIGMMPDQMESVFEPFARLETSASCNYSGMGLGLAISKNLVELMGGELLAASTPGVGSRFYFELTFDTLNATDDEILEKKLSLKETEKPSFKGEVLLCEDDVLYQQIICNHLERVGLDTIVADNGKIGAQMVQDREERGEKQFDLILMDIYMPEMDGLEAASKILELKTEVPIIAMTANIEPNDWEIYRMSGMDDCLSKPFSVQELWRCLAKYFIPAGERHKKAPGDAEEEFQQSLLKLFVQENQHKYEEIVNALEAGDIKLAQRIVDALKSYAGQIGKPILQRAAADVEYQLREGIKPAGDVMMLLETELSMVLNEFTPLLDDAPALPEPDRAASVRAAVLAPEKIRELFKELEVMLKAGNPDCLHYAGYIRALSWNSTLENHLIQHMDDQKYEAALAALAELKKAQGFIWE